MPANTPREGRRPTIRDVAARAGVSKSLVSLVYASPQSVSEARRQLVLSAAEELGFRPNQAARSLAAADGGFIGILVADMHNPVLADLVDAARIAFAEQGQVALATTAAVPRGEDGDDRYDHPALELFGDLRPSGLLIVGSTPHADRLLQLAPGRPVVLASTIAPELPRAHTVRGHDWRGIHLLIQHLLELGHREIHHIAGPGDALSDLRAEAYRAAMTQAGLGSRIRVEPADYAVDPGRSAARALLEGPNPPTAIVATNDLAAVGALAAVRSTGRRVAVTGYDGTFVAGLDQIDLTTIDPNNAEIGRIAARLFTRPGGARETLIEPRLVVRGSTRNP